MSELAESMRWRVGTQVPINVYEGDKPGRPICQCHTAQDARRIVRAVNTALITIGQPLKRRLVDNLDRLYNKFGAAINSGNREQMKQYQEELRLLTRKLEATQP